MTTSREDADHRSPRHHHRNPSFQLQQQQQQQEEQQQLYSRRFHDNVGGGGDDLDTSDDRIYTESQSADDRRQGGGTLQSSRDRSNRDYDNGDSGIGMGRPGRVKSRSEVLDAEELGISSSTDFASSGLGPGPGSEEEEDGGYSGSRKPMRPVPVNKRIGQLIDQQGRRSLLKQVSSQSLLCTWQIFLQEEVAEKILEKQQEQVEQGTIRSGLARTLSLSRGLMDAAQLATTHNPDDNNNPMNNQNQIQQGQQQQSSQFPHSLTRGTSTSTMQPKPSRGPQLTRQSSINVLKEGLRLGTTLNRGVSTMTMTMSMDQDPNSPTAPHQQELSSSSLNPHHQQNAGEGLDSGSSTSSSLRPEESPRRGGENDQVENDSSFSPSDLAQNRDRNFQMLGASVRAVGFTRIVKTQVRRRRYDRWRSTVEKLVQDQGIHCEVFEDELRESVPIYKQGNLDMYSDSFLRAREELKKNPILMHHMERWWAVTAADHELTAYDLEDVDNPPDIPERLSQESFFVIGIKIASALRVESKWNEMFDIVMDDWKDYADSKYFISKGAFLRFLFDLVDVWTETCNIREYQDFLDRLEKRCRLMGDEDHPDTISAYVRTRLDHRGLKSYRRKPNRRPLHMSQLVVLPPPKPRSRLSGRSLKPAHYRFHPVLGAMPSSSNLWNAGQLDSNQPAASGEDAGPKPERKYLTEKPYKPEFKTEKVIVHRLLDAVRIGRTADDALERSASQVVEGVQGGRVPVEDVLPERDRIKSRRAGVHRALIKWAAKYRETFEALNADQPSHTQEFLSGDTPIPIPPSARATSSRRAKRLNDDDDNDDNDANDTANNRRPEQPPTRPPTAPTRLLTTSSLAALSRDAEENWIQSARGTLLLPNERPATAASGIPSSTSLLLAGSSRPSTTSSTSARFRSSSLDPHRNSGSSGGSSSGRLSTQHLHHHHSRPFSSSTAGFSPALGAVIGADSPFLSASPSHDNMYMNHSSGFGDAYPSSFSGIEGYPNPSQPSSSSNPAGSSFFLTDIEGNSAPTHQSQFTQQQQQYQQSFHQQPHRPPGQLQHFSSVPAIPVVPSLRLPQPPQPPRRQSTISFLEQSPSMNPHHLANNPAFRPSTSSRSELLSSRGSVGFSALRSTPPTTPAPNGGGGNSSRLSQRPFSSSRSGSESVHGSTPRAIVAPVYSIDRSVLDRAIHRQRTRETIKNDRAMLLLNSLEMYERTFSARSQHPENDDNYL